MNCWQNSREEDRERLARWRRTQDARAAVSWLPVVLLFGLGILGTAPELASGIARVLDGGSAGAVMTWAPLFLLSVAGFIASLNRALPH